MSRTAARSAKKKFAPGGAVSDRTATVQSLKDLMNEFVSERHWGKFHTPRNLAASVCIEGAELLEHFQWLTAEEALDKSLHDKAFRQAVGEEMADVFLYLISLANALQLDIAATIHDKMQKNRRKYPAKEFQGHYYKRVTRR